MLERLLTTIGDAVGVWLYVIAAAFAFAEASILVGVVLPGELSLLVAGAFCHTGPLKLQIMIPVAIVAAVAGDSVGFEVGRRWGPALQRSRLGRWIGPHRWQAVEHALTRYGGRAVFLARLTALLRALMPFSAGMARMRYRVFLPWNVAGGALWATGVVLLGWAFGNALSTVEHYLTWLPIVLIVVALGAWIGWRVYRKRHRPVRAT